MDRNDSRRARRDYVVVVAPRASRAVRLARRRRELKRERAFQGGAAQGAAPALLTQRGPRAASSSAPRGSPMTLRAGGSSSSRCPWCVRTWTGEPRGKGRDSLFRSLAAHLLARYPRGRRRRATPPGRGSAPRRRRRSPRARRRPLAATVLGRPLRRTPVEATQLGPLLDYPTYRRRQDASFAMSARSVAALGPPGRGHRDLAQTKVVHGAASAPSGFTKGTFDLRSGARDGEVKTQIWRVEEVLTGKELAGRGGGEWATASVRTPWAIERRQTSIWTMTLEDGEGTTGRGRCSRSRSATSRARSSPRRAGATIAALRGAQDPRAVGRPERPVGKGLNRSSVVMSFKYAVVKEGENYYVLPSRETCRWRRMGSVGGAVPRDRRGGCGGRTRGGRATRGRGSWGVPHARHAPGLWRPCRERPLVTDGTIIQGARVMTSRAVSSTEGGAHGPGRRLIPSAARKPSQGVSGVVSNDRLSRSWREPSSRQREPSLPP